MFDLDGNARQRVGSGRLPETVTARLEPTAQHRLPADTPAVASRLPMPAAASGEQPVEAAAAVIRHNDNDEEAQTATPSAKREEISAKVEISAKTEIANTAGQALARSVLQAVARDLPPALLMQAVEHLVADLSPEEADFLRAVLERPLDTTTGEDAGLTDIDLSPAEEIAPEALELQGELEPEHEGTRANTLNEPVKARTDTTQTASVPARPAVEQAEPQPAPRALDTARPVLPADGLPDVMVPPPALRDGVPLAFVPYLPAEEELEWPDARDAEEEEATAQDQPDGDGESGDGAEEDTNLGASGDDPESADMARRREKTADMVGVIEPGLVFYQKLGDYWT
jgi:hypothetical protein